MLNILNYFYENNSAHKKIFLGEQRKISLILKIFMLLLRSNFVYSSRIFSDKHMDNSCFIPIGYTYNLFGCLLYILQKFLDYHNKSTISFLTDIYSHLFYFIYYLTNWLLRNFKVVYRSSSSTYTNNAVQIILYTYIWVVPKYISKVNTLK